MNNLRLAMIFVMLLLTSLAFSQSTTVSATITDTDGQAWIGGSVRIDLVNVPSGQTLTWTGGALTQHFPPIVLNTSGAFSTSVPSSNAIKPGVTKWQFTVCPNASAPCGQYTTAVTGATLSLTTQLSAKAKPPRVNPILGLSKAYNSTELVVPTGVSNVSAGMYYDTLASCVKFYNGSSWNCFTNASNPTPFATGGNASLTGPKENYVCTGTCNITVPAPVAGNEFCVMNGDNVNTVITLLALGGSKVYEDPARTGYGTAGTGTLASAGAVADRVCILGLDATHYLTIVATGTWTAN